MRRVREVLGRLEREGYPRERSRVVASLPFSFWKGLFARRYEELWRTRLRHAFPGAGLRREILEPLTNLHLWRNRIAHHDSLLDQNLERRLEEMVGIANAIDTACGDWLATHTEMTASPDQPPALALLEQLAGQAMISSRQRTSSQTRLQAAASVSSVVV